MRILPTALRFTCGAVLLACNDSSRSPTESLAPSTGVTTLSPLLISGNGDRVTGHGTFLDTRDFTIAARSGPGGEDPRGHLRLQTNVTFGGQVTCLFVVENKAVIGAPIDGQPGAFLFYFVEDNQALGSGVPDRATMFLSSVPADEAGCARLFALTEVTFPVDGNVTVVDAIPAVP
jgi:hypothetical protein